MCLIIKQFAVHMTFQKIYYLVYTIFTPKLSNKCFFLLHCWYFALVVKGLIQIELCLFSLMVQNIWTCVCSKLNSIIWVSGISCIVFTEGVVLTILRTKNMQLFVRETKRKITPNPNGVLFSDDILYNFKLVLFWRF